MPTEREEDMAHKTRYVILTPVRDEEKYLENTIQSVLSQSIKPMQWVIINDGSTDTTGSIIEEYSARVRWIRCVQRENRGFRKAGGGVIEALETGLSLVPSDGWDFIIKMDGDLTFENDYFEKCFNHFHADPKLGIGGGMICHDINGMITPEKTPLFHVRGATKIYRKECWDDIGGLIQAPGWDTLDEVKANMLGWETRTFPELQILHHRVTGAADGSWRNLVKNGEANYISGYHNLFMIVKCLKRLVQKPYLIGSFALLYGFVRGYVRGIPQVNDRVLIHYLRKQQIYRLFFRESIWK